jgi:hypothetical protein
MISVILFVGCSPSYHSGHIYSFPNTRIVTKTHLLNILPLLD